MNPGFWEESHSYRPCLGCGNRLVLGPVKTEEKSNESTAILERLNVLDI